MATRKVTVRPCLVRGETHWRVRYWREGKARREFFKSKSLAESEAGRIRADLEQSGAAWFDLAPQERHKLMLAYHDARQAGVDIFEAIRMAKQGAPAASGAVPLVKTVICEMIVAKRQSGRDLNYVDGLETVLGHLFKGLEEQRIDAISLAQVETILHSKTLASRSTVRSRISTLFKFAIRKGYVTANPCARVEPISYHKPPPRVFTVAQVRKAVKWLKKHAPHGLAWFGLSTFCGLRPEEAEKTVPARDIDFKEGLIRVEQQTTKVRMRRVVYPRPEAMAFVKWALSKKVGGVLPLTSQRRKRVMAGQKSRGKAQGPKSKGLRDGLGFKVWPKDITRHTAASYWLGAGASAGQVSEALGNSEKVLKKDYKALVTRVEAEEFWKVVSSITKKYSRPIIMY